MTAAAAAHTEHSQYCRQSNPSDWANTVRHADRQWRELPCVHLASQKIITACALRIVPAWDFGEREEKRKGWDRGWILGSGSEIGNEEDAGMGRFTLIIEHIYTSKLPKIAGDRPARVGRG